MKWWLLGIVTTVLVFATAAVFIPGKLNDAVNSVAESDFARQARVLTEPETIEENTLVEMVVDSIRVVEGSYGPILLLKEKTTERCLPVAIGVAEAYDIQMILDEVHMPRPLTHTLLCSVVDVIGASIDSVVIDNLQSDIFYAKIILSVNWKQVEVDSRPSDAVAIALTVGVPIYAEQAVLDEAGVQLDQGIIF